MRQNFPQLIQEGREFEDLNIEDVIDILQDDELNVRNEETVFKAVKKWVEANPTKAKHHLLDLLKCVRFGTLSNEFVSNVLHWKPIKDNSVISHGIYRAIFSNGGNLLSAKHLKEKLEKSYII